MGRNWDIDFEYDEDSDVVFVYPAGNITNERESQEFYATCTAYYETFGRKIDVIIALDDLNVERGVDLNRDSRAELFRRFVRHAVLVSSNVQLVATAAHRVARDNADYQLAPDARSALALIKSLRNETEYALADE